MPEQSNEHLSKQVAEFRNRRLFTSVDIVFDLASYQSTQAATRLFPEDDADQKDEMALFLLAQAYGWVAKDEERRNAITGFLQKYQDAYAPVMPPPLFWGQTGHLRNLVTDVRGHPVWQEEGGGFQKKVAATLDYPVITAWVYTDSNDQPEEIIICGLGLPKVQE